MGGARACRGAGGGRGAKRKGGGVGLRAAQGGLVLKQAVHVAAEAIQHDFVRDGRAAGERVPRGAGHGFGFMFGYIIAAMAPAPVVLLPVGDD